MRRSKIRGRIKLRRWRTKHITRKEIISRILTLLPHYLPELLKKKSHRCSSESDL
jgi:hypothetical protein